MGKKLIFSLQGADFNDDEVIDAFARPAWEQAVAEIGEDAPPAKPEQVFTKQEGQEQ